MTEAEWTKATDPTPMIHGLLGTPYSWPVSSVADLQTRRPRVADYESFPDCRASDRKLRLFAVACYHRIRHRFSANLAAVLVEDAVAVAERSADGDASAEQLADARGFIGDRFAALEAAWRAAHWSKQDDLLAAYEAFGLAVQVLLPHPQKAAYYASSNAYLAHAGLPKTERASNGSYPRNQSREKRAQVDLLRCVFGNPFRESPFEPAWVTSTAVALAAGIYAEYGWDRLPVLADALADGGCEDAVVLDHLRGPGPHARGCWVIDEVLGKK